MPLIWNWWNWWIALSKANPPQWIKPSLVLDEFIAEAEAGEFIAEAGLSDLSATNAFGMIQ